MKKFLLIVSLFFAVTTFGASAGSHLEPTEAELELSHTKLIYFGYIGVKEEQIANMLKLTIERVARTKKIHENSGLTNSDFVKDLEDFNASLLAVQHMNRARDASRLKKRDVVINEMITACEFANQTTYLDSRLEETCNRFQKFGNIHFV